jgi:hypothetical protein
MSKYDYKEFMQNLSVGVCVAAVKAGVDYFTGNKPSLKSVGKMVAIGTVGDLINDQIKTQSWWPFKPTK